MTAASTARKQLLQCVQCAYEKFARSRSVIDAIKTLWDRRADALYRNTVRTLCKRYNRHLIF